MTFRNQRTLAFLLVSIWTASFAGLVVWDQSAAQKLMAERGANPLEAAGHARSAYLAQGFLWLLGVAGILTSFFWFQKLHVARERIVAAFRESEHDLASVLASIDDLVFGVDAQGRVELVDGIVRLVHGFNDPGKFDGHPLEEVFPADAAKALRSALAALDATGLAQETAYTTETDGRLTYWNARISRRRFNHGGGSGAIVVARDTTRRGMMETALRDSEERWRLIYERSSEGIVLSRPDGTYVAANRAACEILEMTEAELVGLGRSLIAKPSQENLHTLIAQRSREGVARGELRLRRKDGTIVEAEGSSSLIQLSDGQPRVVTIFRDVTARNQAEAAARENALRWEAALDALGDGLWDWDNRTGTVFFSVGWKAMRGYADHEIGNRLEEWSSRVHPDDWPIIHAALDPHLRGETPACICEYRVRCKDGSYKWILDRGRVIARDEQGQPLRMVGTHRDMTAHHAAAAALSSSERRFANFVNHLDGIVWEADAQTFCFSFVSPPAEKLLGYPASAWTESPTFWSDHIHPDDRDEAVRYCSACTARGEAHDFEYRMLTADGREIWLRDYVAVEMADGKPVTLRGVMVDITTRKAAEAALRESRESYAGVLNTVTEAIYVHDERGVFLDVNDGAVRMYGWSREELIGKTPADVAAPGVNDLAAVGALIGRVFATGDPAAFEFWGIRKNGETFPKSCITNRGKYFGRDVLITTARDVTALKQAEAELRKLSRAVEQSPVSVIITDTKGTIEYVNASFTAKTGYARAEVLGQNARILKSGEQPPAVYRAMWQAIGAGREWRGEFHSRRKNGELFWETLTISPIFDDAGTITHYIAAKEDITEKKRAEERIREQAALLDVTQDAVLVLNLDREITYWNRAAEKLYGLSAAQAVGRRYETVAYRELPAGYEADWREFLERGQMAFERRQVSGAGEPITVQLRATFVREAGGRPRAALIVVTDITEARLTENKFLRAQRIEILGSLASGVTHDLNNVLTPILLATEMLRPLAREPHDRELVQLVEDSARRGADIVQQLLLFGRGSDTPRTTVEVGSVLRGLNRMMQETFPKNVSLRVQSPKEVWAIEADHTQIHQVLLNLCVNARDAMPKGGELAVTAENAHVDEAFAQKHLGAKPGPHVAIRVADTGAGIAEADVEKIFDPFFTTKPIGQGTGLGLATVLGITRSHGGFVSVETQKDFGSTFSVFIPAKLSPTLAAASEVRRHLSFGREELVLLVDDEAAVRGVLERAFVKANYRVVVAANGAEALAVFAQHAAAVRLVVTDMMMPIMDGTQLIHALRRLNGALPVIAMSGLRDTRAELEKTYGRHLRILPKPFLADVVLRMARELIDETARPA